MKLELHLGAHKTATTYIQDILDANRALLALNGTAYWPLLTLRSMVRAFFDFRSNPFLLAARSIVTNKSRQPRLIRVLKDHDRVLLSDENFMGSTHHTLESIQLYPLAEKRLMKLRRHLPDASIRVWLCIRNQGDFLASTYAEALRHGYSRQIDEFVERHSRGNHSWSNLVRRIKAGLGDVEIIVWRYEDFGELGNEILEGLTRLQFSELSPPPISDGRPSASARAVEEQDRLLAEDPENPAFLMLKNEARFPRSDYPETFDPWSEEMARKFEKSYQVDVDAIRKLPFVKFLHPNVEA